MAFVSVPLPICNGSVTPMLRRISFLRNGLQNAPAKQRPTTSISRRAVTQPKCSEMGLGFPEKKFDEDVRIGVISARWNTQYVEALLKDVKEALSEDGIEEDKIVLMQVPGAYEIPIAARLMCAAQKVDAIVCLGVLIKGETDHYEYIANAVSSGLMDLQLTLSIPIMFGVLCCTTEEQAAARSIGEKSHAKDWAKTAIEMAHLRKSQLGGVSAGKKSVGFF